MLQIFFLLILSWLILWTVEKENLFALGVFPSKKVLSYAILLFIISAIISTSSFILKIYIAKENYLFNRTLNLNTILLEIWYQIRTVLTEELIFRGALLYLLIKKTGNLKAIIISSVLFGLIHLSNNSIWGNSTEILLVFFYTFLMGLLLSFSFAKTKSILIPFAIHLGWNLIQNFIFSGNSSNYHIFELSSTTQTITISYFEFYIMLLFPKVAILSTNYLIIKNYKT